jgi:predicted nucleic acid-binding protein
MTVCRSGPIDDADLRKINSVEVADYFNNTGEIRRHYQTHLADALIAATALMHHLRLATRNLQYFTPIEGLQVEKPYD